jgi:hypothetical protein
VIETLLNEDAVPAAARRGAISARGSRRLFDRLAAVAGMAFLKSGLAPLMWRHVRMLNLEE